jgi:hypothetical protein
LRAEGRCLINWSYLLSYLISTTFSTSLNSDDVSKCLTSQKYSRTSIIVLLTSTQTWLTAKYFNRTASWVDHPIVLAQITMSFFSSNRLHAQTYCQIIWAEQVPLPRPWFRVILGKTAKTGYYRVCYKELVSHTIKEI